MARAQLSVIAQSVNASGLSAVLLTAVRSGSNDIAFRAQVATATGNFEVADDAGKLRTFRDADDFFKQAGALSMLESSLTLNIVGLELVAPKPFTGNVVTKNENLVVSMTKRKDTAAAKLQALNVEIALMEGDPTIAISVRVERADQRNAVAGLIAWLDAEITRINGLLGAGG